MEKILTNPTCRDTEQVHVGHMGGYRPGPLTLGRKGEGKGKKKKRGKGKRGTKNQLGVATLSSGEE